MPGSGAEIYGNPDREAEPEPIEHKDRRTLRAEIWHGEFIEELLWEIEVATPDGDWSVDAMHSFLVEAGRIAAESVWERWTASGYWVTWSKEEADDAENLRLLALEREHFEDHLTELLSKQNHSVLPLPYRRTLSIEEADAIWDGLHARWPSSQFWHYSIPDLETYRESVLPGVFTFWWSRFAENVPLSALRAALWGAGAQRVWHVPYEHVYEVELGAFVP